MPDLRDRLAAALAPRYVVDRELASGGMGTVFLGHDPTLGREVAIKVLPPERATAIATERFVREARLLARLAHPNIVAIYDSDSSGPLPWFVMPRVAGDTLAHSIARGPLPMVEVRRIGIELLGALQHAHEQGVIHRDIKPANIFLDGQRTLLADFGVALFRAPTNETLTGTDQVVGTLRYMAPEQRAGGEATAQSDIYALGVTLFECVTAIRWDAVDPGAVATWRAVPGQLRDPLRRALQVDTRQRWSTAAAFRNALEVAPRTRFRTAAIGLAALVGSVIVYVGARGAMTGDAATSTRADLVVLPFGVDGDTLGAELARLTSLPIEFTPVRVLPAVIGERLGLDSARRIARATVTGKFVVHAGVIDAIDIQVFDSAGLTLAAQRIPRQKEMSLWALAIADTVMRRIFSTHLTEFRQLAPTHPDRNALDAYSEGQRLFQSGRWRDAELKFADAERFDTQFVEATWHKLIARQWQGLQFKDDLERLALPNPRMPVALGRLVRAQVEPDLGRRFALYDSLEREYPDYSLVREMAANERFSRGPLVGRPLRDGIQAYQDAGRDIPELNQPNTYTQTVWGAVRLGDERLAREQLAMRRAPPGDPWTSLLWLAVNGRFRPWLAVPVRELMLMTADSSDVVTLSRAARMGLDVDDPVDQLAIARFLERRATSDSQRANAFAAQSTALLLLGRPLDAIRQIDRGASFAPRDAGYQLQRGEWRVLLPLLPGAPIALPMSTRDSGRILLRAVPASDALWPRAVWALAVDAIARHADLERDSLISLLQKRPGPGWVEDLAAFATAIAQGAADRFDSALALTLRIHRIPSELDADARGPFVRAFVYLHRGAWRAGKRDSAGAEVEWIWHENSDITSRPQGDPGEGEIDAALSAVARLLRAENLPSLDRQAYACELLDRVAALWRSAEPALDALQARVVSGRKLCHL